MATVWTDTLRTMEAAAAASTVRDVEAARSGDRGAYARLVARHQRRVASITLAITTDLAASEDAAQEAFLMGWRDLSRLDDPQRFEPWICQIARNRAHDLVRARKKADPTAPEALDESAATTPDALEALVEAESERLISGALRALPEDAREVMVLYYREGQSIAEVAAALGVSEDVVKKRLSRARERMRKSVETALGAALIASVPTANLFVDAIAEIGTASPLSSFAAPKSLPGLGPVGSLATTAAKVALVGVMGFAAVQALQPRATRAPAGSPPGTSTTRTITRTIQVPAPPSIRGVVTGVTGVSGTLTLTCAAETRTIPIVDGAFEAAGIPAGECTATTTLDGYPGDSMTRTLRIREGELVEIEVKLVPPAIPGHGAVRE